MSFLKEYKYKNLSFFLLSILFAVCISRFESFHTFLLSLEGLGYLSIFIAGFLFVSTFTVSTGIVILLILAEAYSPLEIGLIAGLGAAFGDVILFQFVKDRLIDELREYYDTIDNNHKLLKILHTKSFRWTLPAIGAVIVASPLPDELGVGLMGISKMKTYQFLLVTFPMHAIVIFLLTSAASIIKP